MTAPDITRRIHQVIAEQLTELDANTPAELTPETRFIEDLGADSLDLFDLQIALEGEFGLNSTAQVFTHLTTVGSVEKWILTQKLLDPRPAHDKKITFAELEEVATVKDSLTVQTDGSETPETDKKAMSLEASSNHPGIDADNDINGMWVEADFARTLERQRNQARKELAMLQADLQLAYEDRNRARMKEEQKWSPQLDDQRAKMRKMHRRAQNAEGQTCQFRRLFDKWKSISEFWQREFLRHHGLVELKVAQSKIAEGGQIKKMCRFLADENKRFQLLLEAANADNARLREALEALFVNYKELADSGDAGNWTLEDQIVGKQALKALSTPPPPVILQTEHDAIVAELNQRLIDRTSGMLTRQAEHRLHGLAAHSYRAGWEACEALHSDFGAPDLEEALQQHLNPEPEGSADTPVRSDDASDPYESEEYQKYVASVADQCRCNGPVCAGVLAGGFCDTHDDELPA